MLVAHKIRLNQNNKQQTFFEKCAGTARFSYNWALDQWKESYNVGNKPQEAKLRVLLNKVKYEEFAWMQEVPKSVIQQSIKDLGAAYHNAFRRIKQNKKTDNQKNPFGFPVYKKKFKNDSFRVDNGPPVKGLNAILVKGKKVKIPKLGWVKLSESIRFPGQIKSTTISRQASNWFISFLIDTVDIIPTKKTQGSVGVDLGVKSLAVLSNGEVVEGPKAHKNALKKLRKWNKKYSRTKKGSGNRKKVAKQLGKLHYKITCIRQDSLHKLTSRLAKDFKIIGIEDLNVSGMVKNHNLARAISDCGFGEFKRQLEYKAAWYGSKLFVANCWFPSTKTCSVCGHIQDMPLNKRIFTCDSCKIKINRDKNAAINLENLAVSSTDNKNDCGDESSGSKAIDSFDRNYCL